MISSNFKESLTKIWLFNRLSKKTSLDQDNFELHYSIAFTSISLVHRNLLLSAVVLN